MTLGGWINLLLSLSLVTGLFVWCVWKLLTSPKALDKDHLAHIEPVHEDEIEDR